MSNLQHKIDFIALISVENANCNGDPLNANMPRTDYEGYGEISDVCIKRKIRNRMQDLNQNIFVKMDDKSDDGYENLKERAEKELGKDTLQYKEKTQEAACKKWLDVRAFGQVFAYGGDDNKGGVSTPVRGPVSLHQARSISPVEVVTYQITKSVNNEPPKKGGDMSSDRMGQKHFVRFGLYELKGSINVQLAEKTGFSDEDAEIIKECLRTLFVNDASSARPEGSMEVVRLYWFKHNCKDGQYSSAKVHRSLKITQKDESVPPASVDDYIIELEPLPGLEAEVIDGI